MSNNDLPSPENPEKFEQLKLSNPKTVAAGIPAVLSSAKHVFSEMNASRGIKALLKLNQKDGYDCPGCAWPDPDDERSAVAEYCENGAKAIAEEATTKALFADFFGSHSIQELAALDDYRIGKMGRIAQPMYLREGATHYQPISWDDAFQLIARHLHALPSPDEAIFYTSGRTSNEAAFLYQLMVRAYGTNNLPDCSNMCHESSGVALSETLGIGKGSVTLEDFYKAEVILILGQNPGTNHPRMLTALQRAKENGCKIISINPLPETGLMAFRNPQTVSGALGIKASLTDIFLQVKINGDMALLKAINRELIAAHAQTHNVLDHAFIQTHTQGFATYAQSLETYSTDELLNIAGIEAHQLTDVVNSLKHKKRIIACWAMGLTQHKNAVDTIKEVVNLLLLKGSIGIPGGGTCPVRGHSNVQGDRTMGIYEKPSVAFLSQIERQFGFKPPQKHGYDVVDSIKAMHAGKAHVFIAMGGNFLSATPDTQFTAEALRKCRLTVHISTKLNRSHLITGKEALILPTLGRSDQDVLNGQIQFVTCENSMGVVQMSKGNLKPVSDNLLSEPIIVCEMAKAIWHKRNSPVDWHTYTTHYDTIRDAIEHTIPGFDQYNKRVREPGGFYLPNASREGKFQTMTGKALFSTCDLTTYHLQPDELMMMTIRSHDQFNTTIYGLNDRYRGISNERRIIFMNEADMQQRHLRSGDVVDLFNTFGNTHRVARKFIVVPFSIPQGCTATYFPEANVLVPIDSVADKSNTPTSKFVAIRVQKHESHQTSE